MGRAGCSLPVLPLLLVPITRRSYGKFQDYCSQYSLFNQAGKHRGQKKGTQNRHLWDRTWAMNLPENPFCWTFPALIQPLTLQVRVPRWEFPSELNTWGTWKWNREKWGLNPGEKAGIKHFHFLGGGEGLEGGRVWGGRQGKLLLEAGSGLLRSRNEAWAGPVCESIKV